MNEIEQYISRVCRHVGGSVSLRKHIRQELLQHIQDLTEHYVGKGMTQEDAARRAIQDFGEPYEVSEGLEAVHGHSLMSLVLEKSLEWKEKTMKPIMVWNSLAHIVLLMLLLSAFLSLAFPVVFIMPRAQAVLSQIGEPIPHPMQMAIDRINWLFSNRTITILGLGGIVLAWVIFEWKCRVEYKALIRFCVIGLLSLVMLVLSGYIWTVTDTPLALGVVRMLYLK